MVQSIFLKKYALNVLIPYLFCRIYALNVHVRTPTYSLEYLVQIHLTKHYFKCRDVKLRKHSFIHQENCYVCSRTSTRYLNTHHPSSKPSSVSPVNHRFKTMLKSVKQKITE